MPPFRTGSNRTHTSVLRYGVVSNLVPIENY